MTSIKQPRRGVAAIQLLIVITILLLMILPRASSLREKQQHGVQQPVPAVKVLNSDLPLLEMNDE